MPQLYRWRYFNLVEYLRRTGWCVWQKREIDDHCYGCAVVNLWDVGGSIRILVVTKSQVGTRPRSGGRGGRQTWRGGLGRSELTSVG